MLEAINHQPTNVCGTPAQPGVISGKKDRLDKSQFMCELKENVLFSAVVG